MQCINTYPYVELYLYFFFSISICISLIYTYYYMIYMTGASCECSQAVWSLLIKLDDSCAHDALVISAIAVLSSVALHQLGSTFHVPQWWPKSKSMFFLKG